MYFSGRISGYEECIDNILFLKNKYDITFFCSLNIDKITDCEQKFFDLLDIKEDQYYFEALQTPSWIYDLKNYHCECCHPHTYSQFYNNSKCQKLIDNFQKKYNLTFDCIIKFRADLITEFPLEIKEIEPNTLYVPDRNHHYGINDQICYGDLSSMRYYSLLFPLIQFHCNERGVPLNNEVLIKNHIEYLMPNIKLKEFYFPYQQNPNRVSINRDIYSIHKY